MHQIDDFYISIGPIINGHCPIVIGDFINSDGNNNFKGYIDEVKQFITMVK